MQIFNKKHSKHHKHPISKAISLRWTSWNEMHEDFDPLLQEKLLLGRYYWFLQHWTLLANYFHYAFIYEWTSPITISVVDF